MRPETPPAADNPPALEEVLARLADRLDALLSALPPGTAGPAPALVNARQLAAMLSVSAATLDRLQAAGHLPAPLTLGAGCRRWRREEIEGWLAAGAPPRSEWEDRRRANGTARHPG